jgi:thiol-disulfide isomerase/thioredoxin
VARAVIAFEFLLGAFLMLKCFYKYVWWLTIFTLIAFTLFLLYVAFFRNDANCHCMGEFIKLNPLQSIIKNVICIVPLLFIKNQEEIHFRFKKWVVGLIFAVALIVPFVVFPMDTLYNKFTAKEDLINESVLVRMQQDSVQNAESGTQNAGGRLDVDEGNYLVAVVASGCKYCKLSSLKITEIVDKNQLNKDRILFLIWGSPASIEKFKADTHTDDYHFQLMQDPNVFLNLSFGKFPTFFYTENGKMTKTFDYRGLEESDMCKILGSQSRL